MNTKIKAIVVFDPALERGKKRFLRIPAPNPVPPIFETQRGIFVTNEFSRTLVFSLKLFNAADEPARRTASEVNRVAGSFSQKSDHFRLGHYHAAARSQYYVRSRIRHRSVGEGGQRIKEGVDRSGSQNRKDFQRGIGFGFEQV